MITLKLILLGLCFVWVLFFLALVAAWVDHVRQTTKIGTGRK